MNVYVLVLNQPPDLFFLPSSLLALFHAVVTGVRGSAARRPSHRGDQFRSGNLVPTLHQAIFVYSNLCGEMVQDDEPLLF